MDPKPNPGGPKTRGSGGSGSGSATLIREGMGLANELTIVSQRLVAGSVSCIPVPAFWSIRFGGYVPLFLVFIFFCNIYIEPTAVRHIVLQ
jgi:hypothetical protein